ncbi:MAG: iron-sulfur cluster repair di-iron protein [Bacteroidetes bacterium GWA2_31_9]|nr:MAG: iron-sulfur cluster repair di-iron protein [Bacteroidetes bacterium GWA2_31_9]
MIKSKYSEISIGEIVANDFRAASIFKNAGIDFCCGGKMSLTKACNDKAIDSIKIEQELIELEKIPQNQSHNFKEWNLDFLCDYIVNTHHKFVLKTLPELVFYTKKIADVHGEFHPELIEVSSIFQKINEELLQHLKMEEEVLFPAIKNALNNNSDEIKSIIVSEIERMSGEHEFAGGAMDKINVITNNYSLPKDACNTYQVTFKLLEQFEDDLHIHVHLENNILYAKALELAK